MFSIPTSNSSTNREYANPVQRGDAENGKRYEKAFPVFRPVLPISNKTALQYAKIYPERLSSRPLAPKTPQVIHTERLTVLNKTFEELSESSKASNAKLKKRLELLG